MRRSAGALAVLFLFGAALAACGGGPSKSSFIRQADGACAAAAKPVANLAKITKYADLAKAAASLVTAGTAQADELAKIGRPDGAKADIDAIVGGLQELGTASGKLETAAKASDQAASIAATHATSAAYKGASEKAGAYGFASCGVGLQGAVETIFGGSQAIVRAEFITKAAASCGKASAAIDRLPEPTSEAAFIRLIDSAVVIYTGLVADLRKLTVAPGDEDKVRDILAGADQFLVKIKEYRNALSSRDARKIEALDAELSRLTTATDAKFDEYGLEGCGTNF